MGPVPSPAGIVLPPYRKCVDVRAPHDADHHPGRDYELGPPQRANRRCKGLSPRKSGRKIRPVVPPIAESPPAAASAATNEATSRRKGGRPHRVSAPTGTKRSTPPSHRPHSPNSWHADLLLVGQSQSSVLSETNHSPIASNATTTSPRRDHPLAFSGFFDGQLAARRLRPVIGPVPSGGPFPSPRGIFFAHPFRCVIRAQVLPAERAPPPARVPELPSTVLPPLPSARAGTR